MNEDVQPSLPAPDRGPADGGRSRPMPTAPATRPPAHNLRCARSHTAPCGSRLVHRSVPPRPAGGPRDDQARRRPRRIVAKGRLPPRGRGRESPAEGGRLPAAQETRPNVWVAARVWPPLAGGPRTPGLGPRKAPGGPAPDHRGHDVEGRRSVTTAPGRWNGGRAALAVRPRWKNRIRMWRAGARRARARAPGPSRPRCSIGLARKGAGACIRET